MTCDEARELLDADARDATTVPEERMARVAAHLEGCAECRVFAEDLHLLAPRVAALPRSITPDRPLWEGIERRVAGPRGTRSWRLLPLAAALLLSAGAAGWILLGRAVTAPDEPLPPTLVERGTPYLDAARDLEHLVTGGTLMATTAASIVRDLDTVDQAIAEARDALRTDPGNEVLQELYLSVVRRRLEVLRRAVVLAEG